MMTESEYQEALMKCVTFKKWRVLTDAVDLLNNMSYNLEAILREVKAERQAIIKMLQSDASNKKKLDFIKSFAEGWE